MGPRVEVETENGFRVDDFFIQKYLFKIVTDKGVKHRKINLNCIPHLLHSIRKQMSAEENASLIDHQLQTYIVELLDRTILYTNALDCRDHILYHLRHTPKFWIRDSIMQKVSIIKREHKIRHNTQFIEWKKLNSDKTRQNYDIEFKTEEILEQLVAQQLNMQTNQTTLALNNYLNLLNDASKVIENFQVQFNEQTPNQYLQLINSTKNLSNSQQQELERRADSIRIENGNDHYHSQQKQSLQSDQYSRNSQYRNTADAINDNMSSSTFYSLVKEKNILAPDSFLKHPKIDFFVFPLIFQMIKKAVSILGVKAQMTKENNLRLQNFIYNFLLSENPVPKKQRGNKGFFELPKDNSKETPLLDKDIIIKEGENKQEEQLNEQRINNENKLDEEQQQSQQQQQPQDLEEQLLQSQPSQEDKEKSRNRILSEHEYRLRREWNSRMNIKQQSSRWQHFKDRFFDLFSDYCLKEQSFKFYDYLPQLKEEQMREKNMLFNVVMWGIEYCQHIQGENLNSQQQSSQQNEQLSSQQQQQIQEDKAGASSVDKAKKFGRKKRLRLSDGNIDYSDVIRHSEKINYFDINSVDLIIYYIDTFEHFLQGYEDGINEYIYYNEQAEQHQNIGMTSTQNDFDQVIIEYQKYIDHPDTSQKRAYLFHDENRKEWTDQQQLAFLEAFQKYMKLPVNNRKIAIEMGVEQNHVKFQKNRYLIGMKKRRLSSGLTPKLQVQHDIANYHPSMFDSKLSKKQQQMSAIEQKHQKKRMKNKFGRHKLDNDEEIDENDGRSMREIRSEMRNNRRTRSEDEYNQELMLLRRSSRRSVKKIYRDYEQGEEYSDDNQNYNNNNSINSSVNSKKKSRSELDDEFCMWLQDCNTNIHNLNNNSNQKISFLSSQQNENNGQHSNFEKPRESRKLNNKIEQEGENEDDDDEEEDNDNEIDEEDSGDEQSPSSGNQVSDSLNNKLEGEEDQEEEDDDDDDNQDKQDLSNGFRNKYEEEEGNSSDLDEELEEEEELVEEEDEENQS